MTFVFSELFGYFAASLGFILVVVILTTMKGRDTVKASLSLVLFIASVIVLLGTLMYSGKILHFPHLIRIEGLFHYLLGPACVYYVLITFKPDFKFHWAYLILLLPFVINLVEFLPFYLSSSEYKTEYYQHYFADGKTMILPFHYFLKATSAVVYCSLQIWILYKYNPIDRRKSKTEKYTTNWFYIFILGQINLTLGIMIDNLTGLKLFNDPFIFANNMVALFLFSAAIALLFFPKLLYGFEQPQIIPKEKYHYSTLTGPVKDGILTSLNSWIEGNNKPFLDTEITLIKVAEMLSINPQHLSQVINERTNLNFSDYINSYRIEEAKLILASPDYMKLTIEAIANKVGFGSKSPFYNAFKKHTGMTPKEFVATLSD